MQATRKEKAIALRRKGKTYSEIMAEMSVARSTLSEWFKSVGLSEPQKQRITEKRIASALRGAHARRDTRIAEVHSFREIGRKEVGKLSERELWLIGTALYWAEGSKQKDTARSTGILFTNSDPEMLLLFILWLKQLNIEKKDLHIEMYVHENRREEIPEFKKWWAKQLHIPVTAFGAVYFKRDIIKTNRKNTKDLYHGLLRIRVRSSTVLNRRVQGWIEGIVRQ